MSLEAASSAPPPSHVPPRRPWHWWIVEYNPFYLLSAVSMLLGVLALSNTTTWDPVPLSRLLPLLGTLQLYELASLGVGVFLYRRIGTRRDTLQLLGLVLLFAVDVSFLMSEIATDDAFVGSLVAGALLLMALAKFGVVAWLAKPLLTPAVVVAATAGLVLLHIVPPLLTLLDGNHGGVSVGTFYALWWVVGLSPLLFDAANALWREVRPWGEHESKWWPRTFIAMPWVSFVIHLFVLHYVYDRPFMAPHAAPLLIGLVLLMRRQGELIALRVLLLGAAVMVSWSSPARLDVELPFEFTMSTAVIGGLAAWLALGYTTFPRWLAAMAGAVVVVGAWRAFGPTWEQIVAAVRAAIAAVMSIVPSTRSGWGITAVVGAFAMLLAGLAFSIRRPPHKPAEATADVT